MFGWLRRSPRSQTDEALAEVAEFKALLENLDQGGLTVDVDFSQVTAAIAEVEALKAGLASSKRESALNCKHYLYLDGEELRTFDGDS